MSSNKDLHDLIAENLENSSYKVLTKGESIEAKIVEDNAKHYLVNLQEGIDAILPKTEVSKSEKLKVGKSVRAFVLKPEDDYGHIILSQKRTDSNQAWEVLETAQKEGSQIEVTVLEANSGGLIVNIDGISGFIPTSQLDPIRIYSTNPDQTSITKEDMHKETTRILGELIGKKLKVMVVEANKQKSKLILSEKFVLNEQNATERNQTLKKVKISDVLDATVTAITPYGVFVNANGLDGLIHLSELSWEKVNDPSELVQVGSIIKVKLIDINSDGTRVAYSLKQLQEDPWMKVARDLKIGDVLEVEIIEILEYGLIVKIDEAVNGLIHKNEIDSTLSDDLNKSFKVGDKVKAIIMTVSPSERKVGLTLKKGKRASKTSENNDSSTSTKSKTDDNITKSKDGNKFDNRRTNKKRLKSKLNLDEALSNLTFNK